MYIAITPYIVYCIIISNEEIEVVGYETKGTDTTKHAQGCDPKGNYLGTECRVIEVAYIKLKLIL